MKNLFILIILFAFTRCEPIPTQSLTSSKKIIYDDHNYEELVGMTQLAPAKNGTSSFLENPIATLSREDDLVLRFDLLTDKFEYLAAKIYHCNKGWNKSILRDMEFLNEINTFRITDYEFSINTSQSYIHYQLMLPKPIISGNYIVAIHRRGDSDDVLLTRKFSIVNNITSIKQQVRVSTTVSERDINQQVEFSINYGDIQVNNPIQDISIVLLQNHRWQTAIRQLKPTLIRPNDGYMEFRSLDLQNNFLGRNEFRFFDMRTLGVTGRNVKRISLLNGQRQVYLRLDSSKGKDIHTQNLRDINGNYILQNTNLSDAFLNLDYANVHFSLKSKRINGAIYVIGRYNNWKLGDENIMRYDETTRRYNTSILLKQGYYDYSYHVSANESSYLLEGSHFQTENDYEILVYYRTPGNVNDELIGYKKFNSMEQ